MLSKSIKYKKNNVTVTLHDLILEVIRNTILNSNNNNNLTNKDLSNVKDIEEIKKAIINLRALAEENIKAHENK